MKKMMFYMMNALICTLFLVACFLISHGLINPQFITDQQLTRIYIISLVMAILLLINLFLAYQETKK